MTRAFLAVLLCLAAGVTEAEPPRSPSIAGRHATILYVGDGTEKDVRVIGDFRIQSRSSIAWHAEGVPMTRRPEDATSWTATLEVEDDARLDYQIVVDGKPRPDARNPRSFDGGIVGDVSELAMPGYHAPEEAIARPDVAKGTLRAVDESWAVPKVTVYLPAGYDAARRYPVVYTPDGEAWRRYLDLPTVLDNLIAGGRLRPVIAVMTDAPEDRSSWYQTNPEYLAYLDRVVAWVDAHYATEARAEARLHVGTSAGGRAALFATLERPLVFGNVALLSASLTAPMAWWEPWLAGRRRPPRGLRAWVSAGTYEGNIDTDARAARDWLRHRGAAVTFVETHQGHAFGQWRSLLGPMLVRFFPASRAQR